MDAELFGQFALRKVHRNPNADEHPAHAVKVVKFIELAGLSPIVAVDFVLDLIVENTSRVHRPLDLCGSKSFGGEFLLLIFQEFCGLLQPAQ